MIVCPHCHGALEVIVVPGTEPLPGGRNPDATGAAILPQSPRKSGANGSQARFAGAFDSKSSTEEKKPYNQGYDPLFLEFWDLYPRHRDKRAALKAWRNAIRRATTTEINEGAIRYRNDPNRDPQFTKYAEGWLNADGWEDEPLPARLPDRNAKEQSVDYRAFDYGPFIKGGRDE